MRNTHKIARRMASNKILYTPMLDLLNGVIKLMVSPEK